MEIWKNLKDFSRYQVSSHGRVKNIRTGRIKTQSTNSYGYFFVNLYREDMEKPVPISVHRLVATTFLKGNFSLSVNHKNGFKKDNRLENLEWMTLAENASHAWKIGLVPILKGENCGKSILKEKQIKDIRDQYALGQTQVGLAKKFGVTQANISAIVKRLTWKHI